MRSPASPGGPTSPFGGLTLPYLAAVALLTAFVALYVVRTFSAPILLPSDPGVYAFTSFYFSQNVSWLPFPRLDLETSWTGYPYGLDHTFLHWSFERDVFFTVLHGLFGTGPWFQLYFLVSLLVTALGAYFLLLRDVGPRTAAAAGLVLAFCNFYAVRKFPLHFPYACVHWTVLGILADYLIVRRTWLRETLSLRLVLARLALLALCLGLDLGYVAGFSLTSFSLSLLWIAALAAVRSRGHFGRWWEAAKDAMRASWRQAASRRLQVAALTAAGLAAAWLYVPLGLQMLSSTGRYDFSTLSNYSQWEHPGRIFVPYLPGYNPETLNARFDDEGEEWGFHFSPGLSFLALGLIGLIAAWRRLPIAAPFLALLLMCLFFFPESFPTLGVFPWFGFARAPGRATCVFPVLLAIPFLNVAKGAWRRPGLRIAAAILAALLITESLVAYRLIVDARSRYLGYLPDESFDRAMEAIRSAPGEAVFEWPFAIAPRSGGMGAYHHRLGGIFQLAQFHHKKGMGAYFGRLHPDNLSSLVEAGWPHLFFADAAPARGKKRQRRDFVAAEWDFVTKFFQLNDFAGLLLYADLLPPETVAGFHARFGEPAAEASLRPGPGRIQFIPRKESWRGLVDRARGLALELERPVFPWPPDRRLDLREAASGDYLSTDWTPPWQGRRYTRGPSASVSFRLFERRDRRLRIRLAAHGRQRVGVSLNGVVLADLELPGGKMQEIELAVPAPAQRDVNVLLFELPDVDTGTGEWKKSLGIAVVWIELMEPEGEPEGVPPEPRGRAEGVPPEPEVQPRGRATRTGGAEPEVPPEPPEPGGTGRHAGQSSPNASRRRR